MKKLIVLAIASSMALAACGKKKDAAAPTPPATEEAAPAEAAPAEGTPAEGADPCAGGGGEEGADPCAGGQ